MIAGSERAEHTPASGTALFLVLFCLVIAALLWLTTPEPGHVDPPPVKWKDLPTCANGGMTDTSDCGRSGVM